MIKTSLLAALMASTANAQFDTAATCRACFTSGGRQCLSSGGGITFYDTGTCCAKGSTSNFCQKPYGQKAYNYCADSTKIKNKFIQNWTCPQNPDKCPAQKDVLIEVKKGGDWVEKSYTWGDKQPTPTADAKDWFCKYHVTTSETTDGYLLVQTEQYGFDESVTIMGQPKVKKTSALEIATNYLKDTSATANPIYQAQFSQKFYLDAKKYDALVSFQPEAVYPENPIKEHYMGLFKIRAKWVAKTVPTADELKNTPAEPKDKTESGKAVKNWDKEIVPAGKWFDRKAFTIGDFEVTFFGLVVGAGGLAAIIIVMSLICCFISYRKRHAIADGARRASSAVRRGSQAIRQSFSGKKSQEQGNSVNPDTFYSNDKPINDVHKDMLKNMDEAAKPDDAGN